MVIIAFDVMVLLSLVRVSLLIADSYPVFSAKLRTCRPEWKFIVCDQLERVRMVFYNQTSASLERVVVFVYARVIGICERKYRGRNKIA